MDGWIQRNSLNKYLSNIIKISCYTEKQKLFLTYILIHYSFLPESISVCIKNSKRGFKDQPPFELFLTIAFSYFTFGCGIAIC